MPPSMPVQKVYFSLGLMEKETALVLPKWPARVRAWVKEQGIFERRMQKAVTMPIMMIANWYFWVSVTASLPPTTV